MMRRVRYDDDGVKAIKTISVYTPRGVSASALMPVFTGFRTGGLLLFTALFERVKLQRGGKIN